MKKNKLKIWRRKELDMLDDDSKQYVLAEFINTINDKNRYFSIEEQEWIFSSIFYNSLYFKNEFWKSLEPYLAHEKLEDARFLFLYLQSDYAFDPNGYRKHGFIDITKLPIDKNKDIINQAFELLINTPKHAFTLFSDIKNKLEVNFLNGYFEKWKTDIYTERHSEQLLKKCCEITRQTLKEEQKANSDSQMGANLWKLKEKQMLLSYRFAYLKAKSIFYNMTEFPIDLWDKNIVFNYESYFHIQTHFARNMKPNLLGKSYFKQDFLPDTIVENLTFIFKAISEKGEKEDFLKQENQLFFELNNIVYGLWIKNKNQVLRISTVYPVEKPDEIAKYIQKSKIMIAPNLYYFN